MAAVRLAFNALTIFEDEEAGDTHVALYAIVRDGSGNVKASFRWNNLGSKLDERPANPYDLAADPAHPNVLLFDLAGPAMIQVDAWADDDSGWPDASTNENYLGGASVPIDPADPASLGLVTLGPTLTDDGHTGYLVTAQAAEDPSSAPPPAAITLHLENLVLYNDEEAGDTHLAIYVYVAGREIFRWNNGGDTVNEGTVASYQLGNVAAPSVVQFLLDGPAALSVEGYADDDQEWPSRGDHENDLGTASVVIDPQDPTTLGSLRLGPTITDNSHPGYLVNGKIALAPPKQHGASALAISFQDVIVYEDEELGDTHLALYADADSQEIFRWNNGGNTVNEVNTYDLTEGGSAPSVELFVGGPTTLSVRAFADDDQDWPSASSNENDLGAASAVVNPGDPTTLGAVILGPTTTDRGNLGVVVNADVSLATGAVTEVAINLGRLFLYQDEEAEDTHMAIYVYAAGTEIFRWNHGDDTVDEINEYDLSSGGTQPIIPLSLSGPTSIRVAGFADDDQDWPSATSNENYLGEASITIDPTDPTTLGLRWLGPTITDHGHNGFLVTLTAIR